MTNVSRFPGTGPNSNGPNFARNARVNPFWGRQCEVPKFGHCKFDFVSRFIEHHFVPIILNPSKLRPCLEGEYDVLLLVKSFQQILHLIRQNEEGIRLGHLADVEECCNLGCVRKDIFLWAEKSGFDQLGVSFFLRITGRIGSI